MRWNGWPATFRWAAAAILLAFVAFSPVRLLTIVLGSRLDHAWNGPIGYGYLFDFAISIVLTVAALAIVFWPVARLDSEHRPASAHIAMRSVDVFWCAGATLAAMIAVAEFQGAVIAPSYEEASRDHALDLSEFAARKAEILAICANDRPTEPGATSSEGSAREAALLAAFCDTHRNWQGHGDELFLAFPAEGTCAQVAGRPPAPDETDASPGPATPDGLSPAEARRPVAIIRELCELDRRLHENRRELVVLRTAIDVGSSVSDTGKLQPYFRFVAILIGLRLFRALLELADEIRFGHRPRRSG